MSSRGWVAILAVLVAGGCRPRAPLIDEPSPGGNEVFDEPAEGDEADRRAIEAAVLESYADLSNGNDEAYAETLARDRDVVVIGVGPDDVAYGVGVSAADVPTLPFRDLGACPTADSGLERPLVLSRDLDVVLHGKEGERSVAWVSDELSYRVPWHCRQAIVPLRYTALFERNLERWDLVMVHVSYGLGAGELRELAASHALLTPAAIERAFTVGPALKVRGVVAASLAADPAKRQTAISDGAATVAIQPAANAVYRAIAAPAAPWLVAAFGDAGKAELDGDRISVSTDEQVAWVAANIRLTTRVGDSGVSVIVRGTFVVEKSGGGAKDTWQVVQSHLSAPVSRADLAYRVFGEEAAGED